MRVFLYLCYHLFSVDTVSQELDVVVDMVL